MSIRTGSILSRTIACVAALTLGGCLTAQYPVTKRVPGAEALINFEDPSLRDAKVVRIHHLDAFEHVAYARFETDQLTLEAVYDTALGEGLALQYDYWMERMADTWNALRSQNKAWGEKVTLAAQHNEMDFQPFRLADGRQCAGFNSEWDFDPRDSFGRPTRVLFGYVCAQAGRESLGETACQNFVGHQHQPAVRRDLRAGTPAAQRRPGRLQHRRGRGRVRDRGTRNSRSTSAPRSTRMTAATTAANTAASD